MQYLELILPIICGQMILELDCPLSDEKCQYRHFAQAGLSGSTTETFISNSE
jgi:hypothetical protein